MKNSPALPENPLLFPVAVLQEQISKAGFPADLQELYNQGQELYSQAMDRALGLQRASLEAAVRLQSEVIESYREGGQNTFGFAPGLAGWMEAVSGLLGMMLEWQMRLVTLALPFNPASLAQLQHTSEELEHGMDMGIGQKKKTPVRKMQAAG